MRVRANFERPTHLIIIKPNLQSRNIRLYKRFLSFYIVRPGNATAPRALCDAGSTRTSELDGYNRFVKQYTIVYAPTAPRVLSTMTNSNCRYIQSASNFSTCTLQRRKNLVFCPRLSLSWFFFFFLSLFDALWCVQLRKSRGRIESPRNESRFWTVVLQINQTSVLVPFFFLHRPSPRWRYLMCNCRVGQLWLKVTFSRYLPIRAHNGQR